mmetsp:Transcript_17587/g.25680  ORF Transcript_17587/g.25680 Transcript_17587/m.25680 type:complete len:308 (-) Transcript_17587:473-1396(-)
MPTVSCFLLVSFSTSSLLFLLLTLLLAGCCQQRSRFFVHRTVGGEGPLRQREASDLGLPRRQQQHGEFEVGHMLSLPLKQHGVGVQQLVLEALHDPHPGLALVVKGAQCEGQRRVPRVHLVEQIPAGPHFEAVVLVHRPLEHRGPGVRLPGLAFARAHCNVNGVDLVRLKSALLHPLLHVLPQDDHLVPVNHVSFHLMHQSARNALYIVSLSNLGNSICNHLICVPRLEGLEGDLSRRVGGQHHVGQRALRRGTSHRPGHSSTSRLPIPSSPHNSSMCSYCNVSVYVASQINLHDITGFKRLLLFRF